jgi:hypothetical protein
MDQMDRMDWMDWIDRIKERESGEEGKNKVGPKKLQLVLELLECGGLAIGKTGQLGTL